MSDAATELAGGAELQPVGEPIGVRDLTTLLIKHYGLNDGHYDLLLEYQFAFGNFGPAPDKLLPSAVIGVAKVGLVSSPQPGPLTVDASEVNPA